VDRMVVWRLAGHTVAPQSGDLTVAGLLQFVVLMAARPMSAASDHGHRYHIMAPSSQAWRSAPLSLSRLCLPLRRLNCVGFGPAPRRTRVIGITASI